jgi:hypothetical protein
MSAAHLDQKEGRKFTAIYLILVLVLNLKGFADIFVFSVYIYTCVNGRDAFFHLNKFTAATRRTTIKDKPKNCFTVKSTE